MFYLNLTQVCDWDVEYAVCVERMSGALRAMCSDAWEALEKTAGVIDVCTFLQNAGSPQ